MDKTTHRIKMATATKSDINNLHRLYNVLDLMNQELPTDVSDFEHLEFDQKEKNLISHIFEDEEINVERLVNYLNGLLSGFHRVVLGYEVLFSNCADKDSSSLEFNKDIKESIDLWNLIESELIKNKTVSITPDSDLGKMILNSGKEATND